MWRTFQLGSTVSKIPEDCFKSRDTFMKLAGRKKTAFITELFKKCLMLWWKQFHTADLKIDPIIKHYTQFPWYYIKRSKKIQHESDTFPLYLWNNESLCGSAYQSQKRKSPVSQLFSALKDNTWSLNSELLQSQTLCLYIWNDSF